MFPQHLLLVVAVIIKSSAPQTTQENFPASPPVKTSVRFGCSELTVGDCSAAEDEVLDTFTNIPDPETCQMLCHIMAADRDCKFFTHSKTTSLCVLYHNRFLDSCNMIGGPAQPTCAECIEDDLPSCDSFIQEDCDYLGEIVLLKTGIQEVHTCQELLVTLGPIYGAKYFSFSSNSQLCVLYDSSRRSCQALSGPVEPALDTCGGTSTTVTTMATTNTTPSMTTRTTLTSTTTTASKTTTPDFTETCKTLCSETNDDTAFLGCCQPGYCYCYHDENYPDEYVPCGGNLAACNSQESNPCMPAPVCTEEHCCNDDPPTTTNAPTTTTTTLVSTSTSIPTQTTTTITTTTTTTQEATTTPGENVNCDEFCVGQNSGGYADSCCSNHYCACLGGSQFGPENCEDGQGFCDEEQTCQANCDASACCQETPTTTTTTTTTTPTETTSKLVSTTTTNSGPPVDCADICEGQDNGGYADSCCSNHYCACLGGNPYGEGNCEEGQGWCDYNQECQENCNASTCC